jgi:hypothetical protein
MDLERYGQCGKRKQFKKSGHDATPNKAAAEFASIRQATQLESRGNCQVSVARNAIGLPLGTDRRLAGFESRGGRRIGRFASTNRCAVNANVEQSG